jgi:O-antigen ligase
VEARRNGILWKEQRRSWIFVLMIGYLLFAGHASSRSSTAILCLFLAITIYYLFIYLRGKMQTVLRVTVLVAGSVAILALVLQLFGTSLQALVAGLYGKDATLSDRTYLWADVMRIGMQRPLLGSGYGGFWIESLYEKLSPMVDNHPEEAHNGYLETFANLGLVGVGLLAILIVQSIRSAARTAHDDFEYGRIRLSLLITVVILNYSEATFTRGTHLWWFGFLVVALYAREWVFWPATAQTAPADAAPATPDAAPAAGEPAAR